MSWFSEILSLKMFLNVEDANRISSGCATEGCFSGSDASLADGTECFYGISFERKLSVGNDFIFTFDPCLLVTFCFFCGAFFFINS